MEREDEEKSGAIFEAVCGVEILPRGPKKEDGNPPTRGPLLPSVPFERWK